MEVRRMRRRGFIINYTVLVLLIPLLLLAATYSDVQNQIVTAQAENIMAERMGWTLSYIQLDLENALKISGKRALATMITYLADERRFIDGMANETMKDLILTGSSSTLVGFDPQSIMKNQTITAWLKEISQKIAGDGYTLSYPTPLPVELKIVPLDSFHIAIKARISNLTITDRNGRVVYSGSIPVEGYTYVVIGLDGTEDPPYPVFTSSRYQRPIQACEFSYPELGQLPIKWLTGVGNSSLEKVVGTYGVDVIMGQYSLTHTGVQAEILNTSVDGTLVNPSTVFSVNDTGVMVFSNISVPYTTGNWGTVSTDYEHRISFTLTNFQPGTLTLVKMDVSRIAADTAHDGRSAAILIRDQNDNPVNFWIERWDDTTNTLWLWMNTTDTDTYWLYYSTNDAYRTRGYGEETLFLLIDDFTGSSLDPAKWNALGSYSLDGEYITLQSTGRVIVSNATFSPPFFVRWRMEPPISRAGAETYQAPLGGANYIEVNITYTDGGSWRIAYWPFDGTADSIADIENNGRTPYIDTYDDALVAKQWIESQGGSVYPDYQIPIYLNSTVIQGINYNPATNRAEIQITDESGKLIPFWIEYWNSNGALIWIKANLTERYEARINSTLVSGLFRWFGTRYYYISNTRISGGILEYDIGSTTLYWGDQRTFSFVEYRRYLETTTKIRIIYNTGVPTRGNGSQVFEFFDDFDGAGLDTGRWNVGGDSGRITVSNGILKLNGDNNANTPDVWIWTKQTFSESYVIGMKTFIGSSSTDDPFWLWYIDSNGYGWMEDLYYDGDLGWFNVNDGSAYFNLVDGGNYLRDTWTRVEIAVTPPDIFGDVDFITYQNQSGPFQGTWSGNTVQVSSYTGYTAESNEPIGLGQFAGSSTEYDFIYVRKYLNPDYLSITVTKHLGSQPLAYEMTGRTAFPSLEVLRNWESIAGANVPTLSLFTTYEANVSYSSITLAKLADPTTVDGSVSAAEGPTGSANVSLVTESSGVRFDWIIVGKSYVTSGATMGEIQVPGSVVWNLYSAVAFDVQPFADCLTYDKYFGVYAAPSFFERLEGNFDPASTGINGPYWDDAVQMQKELGLIPANGTPYPIGLLTFIYQPSDEKLIAALIDNGYDPTSAISSGVSSADVYWISAVVGTSIPGFTPASTIPTGYRVWGVSMGNGNYVSLSSIGFYIDTGTAGEVLGSLGSAWLLDR
ncbi:DUF2341 domain-containing protein [Thermococcus sp. M36]|uniref:DUF2341 domain-containing protein n=1 Tax=Thermococcus sp. M36 TaxID=1638261 RepID=UPI00143CBBB4|nr:DUF2341 domain-containing protein [Thermococcus sp. M36]NJE05775.1 DUF2341 domain-containing protein [Thermococcus sp. M36]